MKFRLGYAVLTLNLEKCSPECTLTYKNFIKQGHEAGLRKIRAITEKNLANLNRILHYNKASGINFYRMSTNIVPLATHPLVPKWDYLDIYKNEFRQAGDFARNYGIRLDTHPDHYIVINSPKEDVVLKAREELGYISDILNALGYEPEEGKMVLHTGGVYGDKKASIQRFQDNFTTFPEDIKKRIILENDDKSYGTEDVLSICRELSIPMVLDVHHHRFNNSGGNLLELLPQIFDTWSTSPLLPKIHFSSPRSKKEPRKHANEIELEDFLEFLKIARKIDTDFDIMLETKNKDLALFKLSKQLESVKWLHKTGEAEFEI